MTKTQLKKTVCFIIPFAIIMLSIHTTDAALERSAAFQMSGSIASVPIEPPIKEPNEKQNALTIALDTVGGTSSSVANNVINFMKTYHYNSLRIYMGWCSSFWTGNINAPMNTNTQTFIDQLCNLCKQNNFTIVCAVSMQVNPWITFAQEEIQVGLDGAENSQGNWVCPTGPKFQTLTKSLVKILVNIMEKYATPRISVDEIVFVTGGGTPTFYSQSMQDLYLAQTGKTVPRFTSTSGTYSTEQRAFIDFAKGTIRDFYIMAKTAAVEENPNVIFQALIDTYWNYPRTSYDTEPWDYYGSNELDELTYEWFYAIQEGNWAGITDGLQRVQQLNPTAKHYFIYGTSTMTTAANMRQAVQLAMNENYEGVSLYEYAKSKNAPFDVSDIVFG